MKIQRIAVVATLGLALAAPRSRAQAEPHDKPAAAPSDADLAKAKKAFGEGKRLFDAKKFAEAAEKFKESYRLSRNPLLLYNVGVTFDQKGDKDLALFYYKKFLADAPPAAAQRGEVSARVKELEAQKATSDSATTGAPSSDATAPTSPSNDTAAPTPGEPSATTATPTPSGDTAATPDTTAPPSEDHPHARHAKGAPYAATDFEHTVIDAAPPGKPLDLTAYAPEDAGWQVVLFYRGAGDATFTAAPMRPHYHELVARIPAARMTGVSVQYYIEVKDDAGAVVTRLGRASSPNLVYLDAAAKARFYPDLDDGDTATTAPSTPDRPAALDEPAALHTNAPAGVEPQTGDGIFDAGSTSFERAKWATTGSAAGLFTLALVFDLVASSAASSLEGDAARSQTDCGTPPCSVYDSDLKAIDSRGRGFATMTNVTLVLGLVAAGGAGYFWYEEHTHPHAREHASRAHRTFVASPVAGDGFYGAAAALSF